MQSKMPIFLRSLSKSPKCLRRNGEMTTSGGGAQVGAGVFPTLSPTASSSRKSFFDTSGIGSISGHALVAIYPVTEKKGRVRTCFVAVKQTLFEVHKTQKDAKNKKSAKHLIDFGDVFNCSIQNEPIQIKDDCICIMDPNISFFVRPIDSDYDLQAWFDWILERSRECRSTKLLRPVFREEFFEAAWDIQIIRRPKLRRDYSKQQPEAQSEDLAEKRPSLLGHRRFCICPTSFMLFNIGCKPNSNVESPDPFERSAFVELALNVISNYGTQEKFFFIRIGRCSEIGGGELWMATEHGSSARAMHERISEINLRESERRRAQGIKINLPTISSSVLKNRAHRERSQTQNQKTDYQQRMMHGTPQENLSSTQSIQHSHQSEADTCSTSVNRKISSSSMANNNRRHQHHDSNGSLSSNSNQPQFDPTRSFRNDSVNCLQSIPERSFLSEKRDIMTENAPIKKSSVAGLIASRFGAKISAGSCGKASNVKMDQLTAPSSPVAKGKNDGTMFDLEKGLEGSLANLPSSANQSARNSLVNSMFGFRLNKRNSHGISNNGNNKSSNTVIQQTPPTKCAAASFNAQLSYDCAEDYMTYDADEKSCAGGHQQHNSLAAPSGSIGSRVSAIARAESRKSSSSNVPMRQFSTSSVSAGYSSDHQQQGKIITNTGDYTEMLEGKITAEPVFSLDEVCSYVPTGSFDSTCWTPSSTNNSTRSADFDAPNAPRAYSLGSRPAQGQANGSPISNRPVSSEICRIGGAAPNSQLLHPCSSNSPPNYLKKSILSQTAKSLHKEALEASLNERVQKEATAEENSNELISHETDEDEQRKRAHSVGSKALIKPSSRKFIKSAGIEDDFSTFSINDGSASRRNTCEANKSMCSSSTCYPHSETCGDHVEIDFYRDESPSIDSLQSLHSRNSSIGMMSGGIRSALDSCRGGLEKPSERFIREKCCKRDGAQMVRKRSVPEILQGCNQNRQISIENTPITSDQNRLHPRRLTYDGPAVRIRSNERMMMHHQHPERKAANSPPRSRGKMPLPPSQSTSSGISTSRSNESTAFAPTETGEHGIISRPVEAIAERKESDESADYVMLNTPRRREQGAGEGRERRSIQQQLSVRAIGTIVESSSSPSSSLSSAENSGSKLVFIGQESNHEDIDKGELPNSVDLDNFPDEYSELTIPPKASNSKNGSPNRERSISLSKCHSPSPPRIQTRNRQSHVSPTTARSYYPEGGNADGSSPTRRKTSEIVKESKNAKMDSPRKYTSPAGVCGIVRGHRGQQRVRESGKEQEKQQNFCNYATIAEPSSK